MSTGKERRRYIRIKADVGLRIITPNDVVDNPTVKNLSPLGVRFKTAERLEDGDIVDMKLVLSELNKPVHLTGSVVWHKNDTTDGAGANDIGCNFKNIEEDNKNTFLKFLCDHLYKKAVDTKKGE